MSPPCIFLFLSKHIIQERLDAYNTAKQYCSTVFKLSKNYFVAILATTTLFGEEPKEETVMKTTKSILHFKFNFDKLVATVGIFAESIKDDLDKLKICKLIYYADKYHLIRYGTPIIGDQYFHLQYGPIPSLSLDIINGILYDTGYANTYSKPNKFTEYLEIDEKSSHDHPVFIIKKTPDVDCLSESEIEAINNTIKKYKDYSGPELIESTHKESPWLKTDETSPIDYRLFFNEEPEADPTALEYMESLSDHCEIALSLEQNG